MGVDSSNHPVVKRHAPTFQGRKNHPTQPRVRLSLTRTCSRRTLSRSGAGWGQKTRPMSASQDRFAYRPPLSAVAHPGEDPSTKTLSLSRRTASGSACSPPAPQLPGTSPRQAQGEATLESGRAGASPHHRDQTLRLLGAGQIRTQSTTASPAQRGQTRWGGRSGASWLAPGGAQATRPRSRLPLRRGRPSLVRGPRPLPSRSPGRSGRR